jgi:hypothetical protein
MKMQNIVEITNDTNECFGETGKIIEVVDRTVFVKMDNDQIILPFDLKDILRFK